MLYGLVNCLSKFDTTWLVYQPLAKLTFYPRWRHGRLVNNSRSSTFKCCCSWKVNDVTPILQDLSYKVCFMTLLKFSNLWYCISSFKRRPPINAAFGTGKVKQTRVYTAVRFVPLYQPSDLSIFALYSNWAYAHHYISNSLLLWGYLRSIYVIKHLFHKYICFIICWTSDWRKGHYQASQKFDLIMTWFLCSINRT